MHGVRFRKADSFPDQSATPGTKRQVFAFNALRISFSSYNATFMNMRLICIIIICINRLDVEGCQQCAQLIQIPVLSCPETIGQRDTGAMVNRPPKPILLRLVVDKRPHLVHFRLIHFYLLRAHHRYLYFLILMLLDILFVYLPQSRFCFFKIAVTVSFEIPRIRPVARVPVQSTAIFKTCCRTSG